MSDSFDPSGLPPPQGDGPAGDGTRRGGSHAPNWRRRAKSVNLRQDGADGDEDRFGMDPATQSLSDALRITYRIVQFGVLLLVGLYALSGFRTVREGEQGIRLRFGAVQDDGVTPGFRFSWPEPFGELVKVQTGSQDLILEDDFFPELTPDEKKSLAEKGTTSLNDGGRDRLSPELDGSNITGDGNIAHTRWAIRYHREVPENVVKNIDPESERNLVLSSVKRGVVRALASVTIDELLKGVADESHANTYVPIEQRTREIAQRTLDELESGIQLDVVSVTARIPPRRTIRWFAEVDKSRSVALKAIEDANDTRNGILTDAAGEAAEEILRQIDNYDKSLTLNNPEEAAERLAIIDSLLAGQRVMIDGREVNLRAYGQISTIMSDALRDKSRMLNKLAGETISFSAKQKMFKQNRKVFLNAEWAESFGKFMRSDSVQQMILPPAGPNGRVVLMLNRDPEINNRITRKI
ncbi:MAG: hypothetical protein H7210_12990, partial [Pyrinomonadaceae bacterium]|nr:hypothetical protein [Phycisphaerales bacterium]